MVPHLVQIENSKSPNHHVEELKFIKGRANKGTGPVLLANT